MWRRIAGNMRSGGVLVPTVLYSFFTLPIARGASKRALYALDLWGRPLVILGAGPLGHPAR